MPIIIPFELKVKDYDYLMNFLKKGKAFVREVRRAEVLLLLHNQFKTPEIVHTIGVSQPTISRIRHHYLKHGLERALYDDKRSGTPRKFSATDRAKVTALACSKPPEGHGQWSLSLLADRLVELKYVESISKAQVGRILKKTR
jgi:putative transposase